MAAPEQPPSRIALLRERVRVASTASDRTTASVPFRQQHANLVVIQVPIDFPLYNVRSGRTHRAQSEYVDRHGVPSDFFDDPEDPEVQRAQHELLLDMVDERGLAHDLIARKQRTPIVLTYDGFIIDGNRRIAALKRQGETEYVNAVVLPEDATDAEIYETEVELQMAAETKAPYNWIDEALHVRYGVERLYEQRRPGEALHAVAQRMLKSDADVKLILDKLSLVDLYLDWHGDPGKYHLIPETQGGTTQQAFTELAQRVAQQQFRRMPRKQQRAIREACFAAIANGGGYMDVRRIADALRKDASRFVTRLRPALPEDLQEKVDAAPPPDPDPATGAGLLGELARAEEDGGETAAPSAAVLNVVTRSEDGKRSGEALIQAAQALDDEERERRQAPDQQIQRALGILRGLELAPQTRHVDEIARALDELAEIVERLTERVGELRTEEE